MNKCLVENCNNKAHAKGLCKKHYMRKARTGTTDLLEKEVIKICKVDGCNEAAVSKGFCNKHYKRIMRTGKTWIDKKENTTLRHTVGIEAGNIVLGKIKLLAIKEKISTKQFIRNCVNRYIYQKYNEDISLIEQPEKKYIFKK